MVMNFGYCIQIFSFGPDSQSDIDVISIIKLDCMRRSFAILCFETEFKALKEPISLLQVCAFY